jgi:hypothetical protein
MQQLNPSQYSLSFGPSWIRASRPFAAGCCSAANGLAVPGQGGTGSLSEAAHALKAGRLLVLLATPEPWQQLLASQGGAEVLRHRAGGNRRH